MCGCGGVVHVVGVIEAGYRDWVLGCVRCHFHTEESGGVWEVVFGLVQVRRTGRD